MPARQVEDPDDRVGVLEIDGEEVVADRRRRCSSVSAASGISSTQCSGSGLRVSIATTLPRGRILVGLEPEDRAVVVDEVVFGVEVADQVDRLGVGLVERAIEDAVLVVGSLLERQDQVLAVVGDRGDGPPFLVLGIFPDQAIVGLRRAQAVVDRPSGSSSPP